MTQDIYLYAAHVPTVWEQARYYAQVALACSNVYMFWCLVLNQIVKTSIRVKFDPSHPLGLAI